MIHKKVKGFIVQSTTRNRIVDPNAPGVVMRFEAVLIAESIVKALEDVVGQCPSDKEILAVSISEVNVLVPVTPWDTEEKDAGKA